MTDNINDYYDVNLKYARLAETGISREAENWHTKVQSTTYPNYSFVRINLEDREQLKRLCLNLTIAGDCIPDKTGDANRGSFELFEHPKRISFF